jgi:Reverse transcriptase (RNA-dependent DNA polymerase)/gag-polypeptide of LTR copia-type/Integrase core domain/GAG-pre-integrase domain/Zinc knuckle
MVKFSFKLDNGGDYVSWKFAMERAMETEGLLPFINGQAPNPGLPRNYTTEQETIYLRWRQYNVAAESFIIANIGKSQIPHLSMCTTAFEMWEKLKKIHMNSAEVNIARLENQLQTVKWRRNTSFEEYVGEIQNLTNLLRGRGYDVPERTLRLAFLRGLPDRVEHLKHLIHQMGDVTYQEAVDHMRSHLELDSWGEPRAYVTQREGPIETRPRSVKETGNSTRGPKKNQFCTFCKKDNHSTERCFKKKKAEMVCYKCQRVGHFAAECKSQSVKDKEDKDHNLLMVSSRPLHLSNFLCMGTSTGDWLIDSGASVHMCNDESLFGQDLKRVEEVVHLGDSSKIKVTAKGTVNLKSRSSSGKLWDLTLSDALLVPGLSKNLISVSACLSKGATVTFDAKSKICRILKGRDELAFAKEEDNLWVLQMPLKKKTYASVVVSKPNLEQLWHERLGHLHQSGMAEMIRKETVKGLEGIKLQTGVMECLSCMGGKMAKAPFPKIREDYTSKEILDLVHSDLIGPISPATFSGSKFVLTFLDDKSGYCWVYLLQQKGDTFSTFLEWKAMVERTTEKKIKTLRSDNGGEYINHKFNEFCRKEGIVHQTTIPYTPEQNGRAERLNRTLLEMARTMLLGAGDGISHSYWGEALDTAAYIRNRCPSQGVKSGKTPFEEFWGRKPDISHLRKWGCLVSYLKNPKPQGKFEAKATLGILIGYGSLQKGYKVVNPITRRVEISRNVRFMESRLWENRSERELAGEEENFTWPEGSSGTADARLDTTDSGGQTSTDQVNADQLSDVANLEVNKDTGGSIQDEPRGGKIQEVHTRAIRTAQNANEDRSSRDHRNSSNQNSPTNKSLTLLENNPYYLLSEKSDADTAIEETNNPSVRTQTEELESADNPEENRNVPPNSETVIVRVENSANQPDLLTEQSSPVGRRSTRERKPPQTFDYEELGKPSSRNTYTAYLASAENTLTLHEALRGTEREKWMQAIKSELDSLKENETWNLVDLPKNSKVVGTKWVLKKKNLTDGNTKFKARLVAKGYSQQDGVDYDETYAPVLKFQSLRMLLAMANEEEMHVHQMDVTTAFLYGELTEEIYIRQPEGFEVPGQENKVCKLNKSLYGLKQSPRCWNHKLHQHLTSIGFSALTSDSALYQKRADKDKIIIAAYVDDLIILCKNLEVLLSTKKSLMTGFKMTDSGEVSTILGVKVTRDKKEGILKLSQGHYAREVLARFNMSECEGKSLPMTVGLKLTSSMNPTTEEDKRKMKGVPYREAVGALMYLMTCTRPDLAAAVQFASRFGSNPGPQHWSFVKNVFGYLQKTKDLQLVFRRQGKIELTGYTDSDWNSCSDTSRSNSGYVFTMGGAAVNWCSKRQRNVSLSSCEAEYVAASEATKEAMWERGLLEELGYLQRRPTRIYCDSQSAIHLTKNPAFHDKSKHIRARYHYVREMTQEGEVELFKVSTSENIADMLTKGVNGVKVQLCREGMGLE